MGVRHIASCRGEAWVVPSPARSVGLRNTGAAHCPGAVSSVPHASFGRAMYSSTFTGHCVLRAVAGGSPAAKWPGTKQNFTTPKAVVRGGALAPVDQSIVWYRVGDLRTADHVGLSQACSSTTKSISPLFVVTPDTPASALDVLDRLRAELKDLRTNLLLRFAPTEAEGVLDYVSAHGCNRIHVRRDADARAIAEVQWLRERLERSSADVEISSWRDELRAITHEELLHTPSSYPDFQKWRPKTFSEIAPDPVVYTFEKPSGEDASDTSKAANFDDIRAKHRASVQSTFVDAIEARYAEDTTRLGVDPRDPAVDPVQIVWRLLERLEADESVDIGRALQDVMWFGLLSPLQIRNVCIAFERENGRLWAPIFRLGTKTVLRWLDAREFSDCSAERDLADTSVTLCSHRPRFYRWRGILTRYVDSGEAADSESKPAVCLIHGFGASAQHWERSIALLDSKYHCYAFCNVGFGRAEKPPFVYTQHVWELFQASFVRDVVKRRTFVAGNSIGGYLASAFACDSDWCAGVALVNSAGTLYSPEEYSKQLAEEASSSVTVSKRRGLLQTVLQESRAARFAACNLLLLYLRSGIGKTLKRVYPSTPDGWTEALELEIRRNSQDYGAVDVIASGFVLPKQRPLNELLASGPPILVLQGALDPLGSKDRAAKLKEVASRASVEVFPACGHCLHDENPEGFVKSFSEWMEKVSAPAAVPTL